MKIKDLQVNQGKVDLIVEVIEKDEPRTFEKFGKTGSVCNAKVKDNTGSVILTLWNDDISKIKVGDQIHLQNGWCSEFKGEKQVSAGKFGKIETIKDTK
ncbi:MAG TPA: DNA-binding protein [Candidatus Nanoarchaeia archaeon]|nr:DNA-binding protein [Candidatus Nanoarchaeia archaeon]